MSFEQWLAAFDQFATSADLPWRSKDLPEQDLRRRYLAGLQPSEAVRAIQQEAQHGADTGFGTGFGSQRIQVAMPSLVVPPPSPLWLALLCRAFQVLAYLFWVLGVYLLLRHSDWLTHVGMDALDTVAYFLFELGMIVFGGGFCMFLAQMIPVWVRTQQDSSRRS